MKLDEIEKILINHMSAKIEAARMAQSNDMYGVQARVASDTYNAKSDDAMKIVATLLPIAKAAQEFTIQAKNYEHHPWHYMYREGSNSYVCLACGQIEENSHLEDCAAIALMDALAALATISVGDNLKITDDFIAYGKAHQWDIHTLAYVENLDSALVYVLRVDKETATITYGGMLSADIPMQLALNMRTAYLKREA